MTNDLISRKALREDLRRFFPVEVLEEIEPKTLFAQIMHDIDNAPTVPQITICCENADEKTIEELKAELKRVINEIRLQGEWQLHGMIYYCSECGHDCEQGGNNFCGNCGARMKGGAE